MTAKLSQRFYEVFGEDVTNELVNWFNAVDATYRADLRDLNETNFARFDAKLEQRLAQSDAQWEVRLGELRTQVAASESRLVKWMFTFWAATTFTTLGTALGAVALLLHR